MLLFSFFLRAADDSSLIHENPQYQLLLRVMQTIDRSLTQNVPFRPPFQDVLITEPAWPGAEVTKSFEVQYTNGLLTKFSTQLFRVGNFQIQWMPATVHTLRISDAHQSYAVETRYLPREARDVTLCANFIFGSINLQTLPIHIEWLQMQDNRLTGQISLLFLPPSLRRLDLRNNLFRKHVAFYGELPRSLEKINLVKTKVKVLPIAKQFDATEKIIL